MIICFQSFGYMKLIQIRKRRQLLSGKNGVGVVGEKKLNMKVGSESDSTAPNEDNVVASQSVL